MILRIDPSSSIPVYAQIVEQIKRAVSTNALKSGDALPSLRETALKLRINPLTVSKAYKQLETEGFIETRHGLGSYISSNSTVFNNDVRREMLTRAVDQLILDAHHLGVPFDDLKQLLEDRMITVRDGFAIDFIPGRLNDE